jgi:hypothetical protein
MWEVTYRCAVVECGCFPITRFQERHPVQAPEDAPRCMDHGQPMTLAGYSEVESRKEKTKPPVRRYKGFDAKQLELF